MTNEELYNEYCVDNKARDNKSLDSKKPNKTKGYIRILKEEIQSLKDHYATAKNDVHILEMRNQAIKKRMDILNGMLEKAYHQITVLNDTVSGYRKAIVDDVTEAKRLREENRHLKSSEEVINNERLRLEDKLVKSGLVIIDLDRENEKLLKLRHCTNCGHGTLILSNDYSVCKDCFNCSKWELG